MKSKTLTNKKTTVSVVIPNLNGEMIMKKNLPKVIAAMKYPPNNIIEIIVVDNASTDGSVKLVTTEFPEVKVIRHKVNRGFSASVNTGLRASKGDLIVLLNTDVIPEKNFLEKVLPEFDDKNVFAVSLHENGYGPGKASFTDGYIALAKGEEKNLVQSTFSVSGGSGVFRRDLMVEIGGMDEKLLSPFYWEDVDLAFRAMKRGYKLLWSPFGVVEHHHETTISKLPQDYVGRIKERNQLLMLWKNISSPSLIKKHITAILLRAVKHPGYFRIIFMALGRLNIVLMRRAQEFKNAKISDEAIFAKFS